jgi:hypothetical protein
VYSAAGFKWKSFTNEVNYTAKKIVMGLTVEPTAASNCHGISINMATCVAIGDTHVPHPSAAIYPESSCRSNTLLCLLGLLDDSEPHQAENRLQNEVNELVAMAQHQEELEFDLQVPAVDEKCVELLASCHLTPPQDIIPKIVSTVSLHAAWPTGYPVTHEGRKFVGFPRAAVQRIESFD